MRFVLGFQAAYYFFSGVWPLVSMQSFVAVTGAKTDLWLVQMVALLVIVVGTTVGMAVVARRIGPEIVACSAMSCMAFAVIDVVHVSAGRISKVYLGDAAVELLILSCVVVLRMLASRA